ncbi:MAG: MarC family protein [Thermoprotei archaeon]|nr:MAG: MarC family protein [Thermoprotei archaeon]RLF03360.1 MAG: MarC family protein [Thermoprotei archaeon]
MLGALKVYWDSFIMLFVVFDAIGNAPVFYVLTKDLSEGKRHQVFRKSVVVAGLLLLFFMFAGVPFLEYYGVTLNDFRIAGGILLLLLAIEGVLGKVEAQLIRSEDIAIVPMATPLLAGPGSIYTVMYLNSVYGASPTLVSILLNILVTWIVLKYSDFLLTKLGRNVLLVLSRLMAFLLAVIAVTMLRQGIEGFLKSI